MSIDVMYVTMLAQFFLGLAAGMLMARGMYESERL